MMKKEEAGILYLCVYNMLCRRINRSRIYSKKELYRMLGETFHVPKNMRIVVVKEMVIKGLIKDLGCKKNNNIYVERIDFDLEKDANKFYRWVGVY